jgi:zinc/manganese transport system permease protein
MLSQEYMRNALLAGTLIALACGVCGWFVVLRGQVFAGDALSHVAFPGALAAAAAGVDERVGLIVATVAAAAVIGALGRNVFVACGARLSAAAPADDTAIGIVFTFILGGLGLFFVTRFGMSSSGGAGIQVAHTLFGSIFGLGAGDARVAAAVGLGVVALTLTIARPLLFASVAPAVAGARGVPTRALGIGFLVLLGVVAAEATQAVGALLLLGLVAAPAGAAQRLTTRPFAALWMSAGIAVGSLWAGLLIAYAAPQLPPSFGIIGVATLTYLTAFCLTRGASRGAPAAS